MLRAVNWGEKLGHLFGGHSGRILRILLLFLCALGVLIGIYRARSDRIIKENQQASKNQLKSASGHTLPAASTAKWVIVGNPDLEEENDFGIGRNYVCSLAHVSREAGWKTIIIGHKLNCCKTPDCYPIHKNQFLKMTYRTSTVMKNLIDSSSHPQAYRESFRNLAYIWAMHRGARYIFDAYVEEYLAAGVSLSKFEEELHRQLHTLALDESLALVEERSRSRTNWFRNPYSHFGRPDVRLLPSGSGTGQMAHHAYSTLGLGHGHGHGHSSHLANHPRIQEFPTFRICEVRPPSIEKFLEIDEGWWDLRAPALVLPGDTMPPLCTRNTLFSPEVFWALPLLPDYSSGDSLELSDVPQNASRIPPWYIRGLWSQSLLGDLGGSIRLTLSRVPTLQLNQDFFVGGDYEPTQNPLGGGHTNGNNRTGSSKLLKRWHCRNRSTYRCLHSMTKELAKSVYMNKNDTSLIDAWIADLRSIHYTEPPILPKRRSHTNPCLGADGLHGVSFFPALEPDVSHTSEDYMAQRNQTLRDLVRVIEQSEGSRIGQRDKRQTERPEIKSVDLTSTTQSSPIMLATDLIPPDENSTYAPIDWEAYAAEIEKGQVEQEEEAASYHNIPPNPAEVANDSYYIPLLKKGENEEEATDQGSYRRDASIPYHVEILAESARPALSRRVLPLLGDESKPFHNNGESRNGKQFKGFPYSEPHKNHPDSSEFPILKAIADNMCPGFAPLLPYEPANRQSDVLLIVVFTNQHYDLIPTLEVLYRSTFSNILYCGHPHESVEIFLRKYQSVEHRSFSFLPTYTRATYECVLGAMEMNYEVKGYMVVTDETLLQTWNMKNIDKTKLWLSTSGYAKVTRSSWPRLDPGGQKLPKLLDGIISTWKLLSSILLGSDSYQFLETRNTAATSSGGIKKRSIEAENQPEPEKKDSNESLDTDETAYIHLPNYRWSLNGNANAENGTQEHDQNAEEVSLQIQSPAPARDENKSGGDLLLSDWDYLKNAKPDVVKISSKSETNETSSSGTDETTEEDVLVGEENEEEIETEETSSEGTSIFSSPPSTNMKETTDEDDEALILATPTEDSLAVPENSTLWKMNDDGDSQSSTTTIGSESSVGVPLYHVEHVEPPTSPTWHKPEDISSTTSAPGMDKDGTKGATEGAVGSEGESAITSEIPALAVEGSWKGGSRPTSPPVTTERDPLGESPSTQSPQPGATDGNAAASQYYVPAIDHADAELKHFMESALEILHDSYGNLTALVADYRASNVDKTTHFNYEGGGSLEDAKSHRISPREFRHIRCTMTDDGHQSDLCTTLRSYVGLLNINIGRDIRLFHDTIPVYYLPTWTTKPFYSVANILLQYGVMDELALPLLFRGLALESDWLRLNRTLDAGESEIPQHYIHPFNFHKVYSEPNVRQTFCSKYFLKILQN